MWLMVRAGPPAADGVGASMDAASATYRLTRVVLGAKNRGSSRAVCDCCCLLLRDEGMRVQDYMVYWAKLSGKGADIGRLQRWLLEDPARTSRICNPFCETDHTLLLRSASAAAEAARLTTSATHINVDSTFAAAARAALAAPGA